MKTTGDEVVLEVFSMSFASDCFLHLHNFVGLKGGGFPIILIVLSMMSVETFIMEEKSDIAMDTMTSYAGGSWMSQ